MNACALSPPTPCCTATTANAFSSGSELLIWFAGGAVWSTWMVFRDPALSYGMVALGALLPDAIDLIAGGLGPGHSVVIGAFGLAGVMLATRGRRRLRRRLLGLPLGFLLHLVLDATWAADLDVIWWPAGGFGLHGPVPSFDRPAALLLILETLGLLAGTWAWRAIRLARQQRRSERDRRGAAPQ